MKASLLTGRIYGKSYTCNGEYKALNIAYGRDLLAEKPIRAAIAKACRASHPASWYPGRESSFEFAARCGLPEELAGIHAPDRQPDFEHLEGNVYVPRLMGFQRE